jgi:hypothetical protein
MLLLQVILLIRQELILPQPIIIQRCQVFASFMSFFFFLISLLLDMNKTISYINRGVELGQPRLLQRAIRQNVFLRRSVTKELLSSSLMKFISSSCPTFLPMKAAIQLLPDSAQSEDEEISLPTADAIPEVEVSFFLSLCSLKISFSPSAFEHD